MTAKNDITGDFISTRTSSDAYREGFDRIWKKPSKPEGTCKTDPRAPHGFLSTLSLEEGRYVCRCEVWTPDT